MRFLNWLAKIFEVRGDQLSEKKETVEIEEIPVKVEVVADATPIVKLNPASDRPKFFELVRKDLGTLTQSQVEGFEFIFESWSDSGLTKLDWLAYMLATTWHETAFTMEPVTEYGTQSYLKGKKYYPYIGRGYVQLTWKTNYERYGIAGSPEKALEPKLAAHILIDGMTKGIFTGKGLRDYFNLKKNDPVGARRIINGTDKAKVIAGYHKTFIKALKASEPAVQVKLV